MSFTSVHQENQLTMKGQENPRMLLAPSVFLKFLEISCSIFLQENTGLYAKIYPFNIYTFTVHLCKGCQDIDHESFSTLIALNNPDTTSALKEMD